MENTGKLLYKYLWGYTGLFLIMVTGSFMAARAAEQAVRARLIAESELKLEKGALRFEQALVPMRSVNENLCASDSVFLLAGRGLKLYTVYQRRISQGGSLAGKQIGS